MCGENHPGNTLRRTRLFYQVNSKTYFQQFAINENKFCIFKNGVISYNIKTVVHMWSASDTNGKWRNLKLIKSLHRTDSTYSVFIMSCGLHKVRILSKRGKNCMEHVPNKGERCEQILVGKPLEKCLLGRPRRKWEDNTKMFYKEWGGGLDWCCLLLDKETWRVLWMW